MVRLWNVLVYVNPSKNSFKFWSYSNDNWVAWGRIGTEGTKKQYPDSHITKKVKSKLSEGYRVFGKKVSKHNPNPVVVQRWIAR